MPGHLPLLAGQAPGGVQMVRVDGVQAAVDFCRNGHGTTGRGLFCQRRAGNLLAPHHTASAKALQTLLSGVLARKYPMQIVLALKENQEIQPLARPLAKFL